MYTLIQILHNTERKTWHPIFYMESPLPGQDLSNDLIRFKSKGHHTSGFVTLKAAIAETIVVESRLVGQGHTVFCEIEPLLSWDGIEVPVSTTLRSLEELKNFKNKTEGNLTHE